MMVFPLKTLSWDRPDSLTSGASEPRYEKVLNLPKKWRFKSKLLVSETIGTGHVRCLGGLNVACKYLRELKENQTK